MERFPAHGGNITWAVGKYGLEPGEFTDFSSNTNPLGPPAAALDAARMALEGISRYPEPDTCTFKRALSDSIGVETGSILPGNGSTELIYLLCGYLRPSRVTIVSPAFGEYRAAARVAGAEVEDHFLRPEDGFRLEVEKLLGAAAGSDMMFFCNPASPSGILYSREEILPLLEAFQESGKVLVVDESFMGFLPPSESGCATMLPELAKGNLVVISTLTKLYALAGVRGPGYLLADKRLVSMMEGEAAPWRVNVVAAAAGVAALSDSPYLEKTRRVIPVWRDELARRIEATGHFKVYPSLANFVLLELLDHDRDAVEITDALGRRGMLVRYCGDFEPLDSGFMRVAVLSPADNQRLLESLVGVLR